MTGSNSRSNRRNCQEKGYANVCKIWRTCIHWDNKPILCILNHVLPKDVAVVYVSKINLIFVLQLRKVYYRNLVWSFRGMNMVFLKIHIFCLAMDLMLTLKFLQTCHRCFSCWRYFHCQYCTSIVKVYNMTLTNFNQYFSSWLETWADRPYIAKQLEWALERWKLDAHQTLTSMLPRLFGASCQTNTKRSLTVMKTLYQSTYGITPTLLIAQNSWQISESSNL